MAKDKNRNLDLEYNNWLKTEEITPSIGTDELYEIVSKELAFLRSLTVEEYTLLRKWREIHRDYPGEVGIENDVLSSFFGGDANTKRKKEYPELQKLKSRLWMPESPDDYMKLEPVMVLTNDKNVNIWNTVRTFTSTMLNNSNIGRNMFYLIIDNVTGKYLGVICISSDFMDLTPRDKFIGWSRQIKTNQHMINHTAIGSTIVPTQPLGYSYVGGKLLALLTISDIVEKDWKEKYGDVLAGVTTTSLYGSFSQYQNLKYWNKRGHSAGSVRYEPAKPILAKMLEWMKSNHTRKYWEYYVATLPSGMPLLRDHRQRSMMFIYGKLGFKKEEIASAHQRGIYFCHLYNNTCEFLRKEITEDKLVKRFDNKVYSLVNIWKEQYAGKRVKSLLEQNRYSKETLWYSDIIYKNWEQCQETYTKQVGR